MQLHAGNGDVIRSTSVKVYQKNNNKTFIMKWSFQHLVLLETTIHCVKSVRIWSYSGPHFPAFGLNKERYVVSQIHSIQSECGKMWTRITPNTDTSYAVSI